MGSSTTDGVIIDSQGNIIESTVLPTGASVVETIRSCHEQLHRGVSGQVPMVATGYGRRRVSGAIRAITEITAHALGVVHCLPGVSTVIDMGGQDTKVILVDSRGKVQNFAMNDKCAAGTGRFIEVMARILETDIQKMAEMAVGASRRASITSTCTVFIESEIVSLISQSTPVDEIAAGVFLSIARRVSSMVRGLRGEAPFVITGGVAKNPGIIHALEQVLPGQLLVHPHPQLNGAIGAALFARRMNLQEKKPSPGE